jgi:hypothetical protein
MHKRLLTYVALYGLGVASALATLVVLPHAGAASRAPASLALPAVSVSLATSTASHCPIADSTPGLPACPYLDGQGEPGCPYLDAVAASDSCPYLARRATLRCPFLALHPELRRGTARDCPGIGYHPHHPGGGPVGAPSHSGALTAELTPATGPAPALDPT